MTGLSHEVMMSPLELSLAILALLVTPGPTNSLVLLAGAERGLRGAARLIPAELLGYLLTVIPLSIVGAAWLQRHPGLQATVTVAAAVWVAVLALRLWRLPAPSGESPSVGARALFVTTALNPKALIFGLVLLPSPDRLVANLASFVVLVIGVALGWAALGAALRGGGTGQPHALFWLRRLASVFLGGMSFVLAARGLGV
jgi:threonine/homoserine/homoserine lactone efflux protein